MLYCPKCAAPLGDKALASQCVNCLNAHYLAEQMRHEAEYLAKVPDPRMELTPGLHPHVARQVDRKRSYCGVQIRVPDPKRKYHMLSNLPEDLCVQCRRMLAHVQLLIKERGIPA